VLKVTVGPDLHASAIEIIQSSGHAILDQAAMDAVKKWTFDSNRIKNLKVELEFNRGS